MTNITDCVRRRIFLATRVFDCRSELCAGKLRALLTGTLLKPFEAIQSCSTQLISAKWQGHHHQQRQER
eukprot:4716429-Amphidinium_carterae.1